MSKKLDPIVLELIHSKVASIVGEMRVVLFHSGYSTVLRESEDGSAGLLDSQLRTVGVSKKLPLHFGSFSAIAEHLPKYYRVEELEEGDIILFNHPYAGNVTHPSDTVILMPVFAHGTLVAYTATLAHKADLGGPQGLAAARDLWEEGLVIPPLKYYVRGEVNREVERLVAANSRIPRWRHWAICVDRWRPVAWERNACRSCALVSGSKLSQPDARSSCDGWPGSCAKR